MSDESCLLRLSYLRQKTQHSVSHRPFMLWVFFINFSLNLLKQFFYTQNRKMCLSKKNLNQYFVDSCPAWDSISSENILYVTA